MTPVEYLRELNKAAEVEIEPSKPLKWYLRSTELVFKQACVYYSESNHEKALILSQLPRHPEFNKTEHADAKAKLKRNCFRAIEILERLRPVLEANFVNFLEEKKRVQEAAAEAEKQRLRQEIQLAKLKEIQAQMELGIAAKRAEEVASVAPLPTEALSTTPTTSTGTIDHCDDSPSARKQARFFSESGRPLRPVHVPAGIIEEFLSIAAENTRKNIETCGVIAGKLHQDEFTITCLIIPKQYGTSDTCSMTNEEEIVEAQDQLDVMSLGWIHTHLTQSGFLSSVDLHTHMPFQMLMEEAIAIVCAPSKTPKLTDPPGLDLINKCPKPGGSFHPHPEGIQIYRELRGPEAHAQIHEGLPLEVMDMRFK